MSSVFSPVQRMVSRYFEIARSVSAVDTRLGLSVVLKEHVVRLPREKAPMLKISVQANFFAFVSAAKHKVNHDKCWATKTYFRVCVLTEMQDLCGF